MARYKRRPKKIEEIPGLWDTLPSAKDTGDSLKQMVEEYRSMQSTPKRVMHDDEITHHILKTTVRPNDLEFISFGSGSSGNCSYLGIRGIGGIIIDAGVDYNKVVEELDRNYIDINKIDGIILTHDHLDHVRYAYQLLRKNPKMQLYCTPRTLSGILRRHNISKRIKDYHKQIFKEFEFEAGPFNITPFEVSHDGSDNVGFAITTGDHTFVVATDMGKVTERADYYIRQANYLMIESNYDSTMLSNGPYPLYLQNRIRKETGHMDNAITAEYLAHIWTPTLSNIYLCHLSHDNNRSEIALKATRDALLARGVSVGDASGSSEALGSQVQLTYLPRDKATPVYIHRL